jgi:hypothetical protein
VLGRARFEPERIEQRLKLGDLERFVGLAASLALLRLEGIVACEAATVAGTFE